MRQRESYSSCRAISRLFAAATCHLAPSPSLAETPCSVYVHSTVIARMSHRTITCIGILMAMLCIVSGCIYEYGTREDSGYTYGYNGQDWVIDFPQCRGTKQSPIALPAEGSPGLIVTLLSGVLGLLSPTPRSTFSYGSVSNPTITNNGHTIQVALPEGFESNVRIPIRGSPATATGTSFINSNEAVSYVTATPAQFHFHTHSEHYVTGITHPLEMHIVHFIKPDQLPACGSPGCPLVLGFLFELTTNPAEVKPEIQAIINAAPLNENTTATVPANLNIGNLLPADQSHYLYEGSLTTPPCSEGLLWHVLTKKLKITPELLARVKLAVGDYQCPTAGEEPLPPSTAEFSFPPTDAQGCRKAGDGTNHRVVQPLGSRTIRLMKQQ